MWHARTLRPEQLPLETYADNKEQEWAFLFSMTWLKGLAQPRKRGPHPSLPSPCRGLGREEAAESPAEVGGCLWHSVFLKLFPKRRDPNTVMSCSSATAGSLTTQHISLFWSEKRGHSSGFEVCAKMLSTSHPPPKGTPTCSTPLGLRRPEGEECWGDRGRARGAGVAICFEGGG